MLEIVLLKKRSEILFQRRFVAVQWLEQSDRRQKLRHRRKQRILPRSLAPEPPCPFHHHPEKDSRGKQAEQPKYQKCPLYRDHHVHLTSLAIWPVFVSSGLLFKLRRHA